jgi:hypothetical protein
MVEPLWVDRKTDAKDSDRFAGSGQAANPTSDADLPARFT